MLYQGLGDISHICLFTLPTEDDAEVKQIDTMCGVRVSPVCGAEVITYVDDGDRVVYDADYGLLPNATVVVAVRDSSGTFPTDREIKLRVMYEPYADGDAEEWECGKFRVVDPGRCPVCGVEEHEEEEGGDDEEEPDPAPEPGPVNRCQSYFKNN
jgi:hypothetical protein